MKNTIKILVVFILVIFGLLIFQNNVEAKSYSIESMDIQATVLKDGSVKVKQTLKYNFNGGYNGIYITIPTTSQDTELKETVSNNTIPDSKYNASDVLINSVQGASGDNYDLVYRATNGDNNKYTIENNSGLVKLKVYAPSYNMTRTFIIDYTLENLCLKHNDIGELYYNFIGGSWECDINNLNIDVMLPNNTKEIKIWGHGPYEGISTIVSTTRANFQVEKVKAGQYVATRVTFDNNENIPNCTKVSGINYNDIILSQEKEIYENKAEKESYTLKIVIVAVCILIYWIILLLIYEKDRKYILSDVDDEELFKKYNPMLAGCIQGSRDILARDILAVILSLINKKNIKLEIIANLEKQYIYKATKNEELEDSMDEIETYIYNWFFDGTEYVMLNDRLDGMAKDKEANIKFKELNKKVEQRLSKIGSNQAKVPLILRGFNVFLFILSIILIAKHIMFNGLNIFSNSLNSKMVQYLLIAMFPLLMGVITAFLNVIIITRHKINKVVQRISGQKIVTTTVSLMVLFAIIIVLTAVFVPDKFLIADEFLLCIVTILVLTDNLMMKNNVSMIEDYSKLNSLKYKIENYSLLKERNIEQVMLWEQYLAYAVSFGVANKIIKQLKVGMYLDDDLSSLINNNEFCDYIRSDYYSFYRYASLDRRFLRMYNKTTGKVASGFFSGGGGSSGGYSGGRRWLFRRRRIFWWRSEVAGGGGAF